MNKNLVWSTDCHINFIKEYKLKQFCHEILDHNPTSVVLTGDLSEAPTLETHLRLLEKYIGSNIPIYFVCGNHDYYNGSIGAVRNMLKMNFNTNSAVQWLPNIDYVSLSDDVALVGHDGWYDGRYSDYFESELDMNDYHCIKELKGNIWCRTDQYEVIGKLASEAAYHISNAIDKAFQKHSIVYVATHVAPFKENSRAPNGALSDKHWMPHFSSKIMGDTILNTMNKYSKEYSLIILSGHNHTFWESYPTTNIRCITGEAQYGNPKVCGVFQY
jgi:predicted phosphohydrolase